MNILYTQYSNKRKHLWKAGIIWGTLCKFCHTKLHTELLAQEEEANEPHLRDIHTTTAYVYSLSWFVSIVSCNFVSDSVKTWTVSTIEISMCNIHQLNANKVWNFESCLQLYHHFRWVKSRIWIWYYGKYFRNEKSIYHLSYFLPFS